VFVTPAHWCVTMCWHCLSVAVAGNVGRGWLDADLGSRVLSLWAWYDTAVGRAAGGNDDITHSLVQLYCANHASHSRSDALVWFWRLLLQSNVLWAAL
jgi:hypothetical protein